ncbi:MAG: selenocysteine-specific translation elongation factor [Gemmatimonadetes bacterium]|nr:selenocysteine-specific translation elongation factor [Gemmatimonadota bacterium]
MSAAEGSRARPGRVVGTAGHIDHGKTELVAALTGVGTDRLPEERERGISIDLGFAPLDLGSGAPPASVVDVPGHEGFVKNMVAGATGVDAVLFVVAADEGMMPQSREHLLVIEALGVSRGVVAVTKADLVEPEWIELVVEEVGEAIGASPLAGAPIVVTSTRTGRGIEALRGALAAILAEVPERPGEGVPFRLPVDRAFAVAGAGTVVTGTTWTGAAAEGSTVRVFPADRRRSGRPLEARIRSIEVHGRRVETVGPGTRTALALTGVDTGRVGRGAMISGPATPWRAVRRLDARVWLSRSAPRPVEPGDRVRVHHGTREVMARVHPYDRRPLAPGSATMARLALERALVPAVGDRLVVRAYSPVETIGGGEVLALDPPRVRGEEREARGRHLAALAAAAPAERLPLALATAGATGIEEAALPVEVGIGGAALAAAGKDAGEDVEVHGGRWFAADARRRAMERLEQVLADHHRAEPLQPALPLEAARQALRPAHPALVEAAIDALLEVGRATRRGAALALADHSVELDPAARAHVERIVARYVEAGLEPPDTDALAADLEIDPRRLRELLAHLEREGAVVKWASDWYVDPAAVERAERAVVDRLADGAAEVGAFKEMFGVSRKYLIPLLEYLDRTGVTRREGDRRVLAGRP